MIPYRISSQCPECGVELTFRKSKRAESQGYGPFLRCSACGFAESVEPILLHVMEQQRLAGIDPNAVESAKVADLKSQLEKAKKRLRLVEEASHRAEDNARWEVLKHKDAIRAPHKPENRPTVSKQLLSLIKQFHPDLHPGNELAEEVTKALNSLRNSL